MLNATGRHEVAQMDGKGRSRVKGLSERATFRLGTSMLLQMVVGGLLARVVSFTNQLNQYQQRHRVGQECAKRLSRFTEYGQECGSLVMDFKMLAFNRLLGTWSFGSVIPEWPSCCYR